MTLDGLAFASMSLPICKLLAEKGVLDWAVRHEPAESRAREHILHVLALAYLWGEEPLHSPRFTYIFDPARLYDLEVMSRFFWSVSNQPLTPELYFPRFFPLLCGQAEQPLSDGSNFLLGDPGTQNPTNFVCQQFTTPRPTLVGVARTPVRIVPR